MDKKRIQLAIWIHAMYPGVRVDYNSLDFTKSYSNLKEELKGTLVQKAAAFSVYRPIHRSIEKLVTGHSTLVFVKGSPGIGKSVTIQQTLEDCGIEFTKVNGDVTEAYLYRLLFENKDGILYIAEASKLMRSVRALNLLKAATEIVPQRVITKHNYSHLEADLPTSFEYNGKLIFDYNDIPNSRFKEDFNALVSRGDFIELLISHQQICEIMKEIAKTLEEKEVTEFLIKEYPFQNITTINLRNQAKAFETFRFCEENGLDWKTEIRNELNTTVSPIQYTLFKIMGTEPMKVTELKKRLLLKGEVNTLRTADRRVKEWIEIDQLKKLKGKSRNFLVSL